MTEEELAKIKEYVAKNGFDKECEKVQEKVILRMKPSEIINFAQIKGANLDKLTEALIKSTHGDLHLGRYIRDVLLKNDNQENNIQKVVDIFYGLKNVSVENIRLLSSINGTDKEKLAELMINSTDAYKTFDDYYFVGKQIKDNNAIANVVYESLSNYDAPKIQGLMDGFLDSDIAGEFKIDEMVSNIIERCKKNKETNKLITLASRIQHDIDYLALRYMEKRKDYDSCKNDCFDNITNAIIESKNANKMCEYAFSLRNKRKIGSQYWEIIMNKEQYAKTIESLAKAVCESNDSKAIERFKEMNEDTKKAMEETLKNKKRK